MPDSSFSQQLVFTSGAMQLSPCENAPLQPGELRVRTLCSGVRHVTDFALLAGITQPQSGEEIPKAWCVAEVIDAGPGKNRFAKGDRVHGLMSHRTEQNIAEASLTPLGWLRNEFAVFVDPGVAALRCVRRGDIQYGDRVLISGMGAVGLMAIQYARLSGATRVYAIDSNPERLRHAQRLGADGVYVSGSPQFDTLAGQVDIAVDLSGMTEPLRMCARAVRIGGKLVAGAHNYENLDSQSFMEIANHTELVFESMFKTARDEDVERRVIDSLNAQHVIVWPIISHMIPFRNAPDMYAEMKRDPRQYLKVLLMYEST